MVSKFPLYRYGSSFLIVFFVYITILFTKNFEYSKQEKNIRFLFNFFLIIAVSAFFTKNSLKFIKNITQEIIFQKFIILIVYLKVKETKLKKIILNNKGYYFFSNGVLCMYGNPPCTHIELNNIVFSESHNYKIFYKKK